MAPARKRRLGSTLTRYVGRELRLPTALTLGGLTLAALTKSLLDLADLLINRGVGATTVAALAGYQLVPVVTQTLPFALLVGALVGLGRLRADGEIEAVEGTGVAPGRLVAPVLAFALVVTGCGLGLSLVGAPRARAQLQETMRRAVLEQPGATLHAGTVHEFGDHRLLAREVSPRGDELAGVVLWVAELGETVFAEHAEVEPAGPGAVSLTLHDAVLLLAPEEGVQEVRVGRFRTQLREPPRPLLDVETDRLGAARLSDLRALEADPGDEPALARLASAELQRRFALPLAGVVFGLAAVPLAYLGRRSSRSAGGVVGLLVTVAYYGLVQLANGLLGYPAVPVAAAVWIPNGVTLVLALWLLHRERFGSFQDRQTPWERVAAWRARRRAGTRLPRARRRPLERYVLFLYLEMAALCFALLLGAYLLIDVLERLQWFAQYRAELLPVLAFYGARLPLLASRVIPMSLLAATALSLSLLGSYGELRGMETCGIRLLRALAPILLFAGLMVPADFLLTDALVTRTNTLADRLKVERIKGRPDSGDAATAIWYRSGGTLLRAARLAPELRAAEDLTIYELGVTGFPVSRIDAREARQVKRGWWELADARKVEISDHGLESVEPPTRIRLGTVGAAPVDTMHMSVRMLAREIREAESGGYDVTAHRVDLHGKLAAPLACLLLPAFALLYAIRARPFPGLSRSLLVSGLVGIGYLLVSDVAASFGYGGTLPPAVAGWSPVAALGLLSGWMAVQSPR